ncbi:MAG: hypothetical protein ACLUVC_05105 [Longibaculum sp.]
MNKKIQLISETGNIHITLQSSIVKLYGQLKAYQSQDKLTTVEANHGAYVHYLSTLKECITIQKRQIVVNQYK